MDLFHVAVLGILFVCAVVMFYAVFGGRKAKPASTGASWATTAESALAQTFRSDVSPVKSRGQRLDDFLGFMTWLRSTSDVTPEEEKAAELLVMRLAHEKKATVAPLVQQGA